MNQSDAPLSSKSPYKTMGFVHEGSALHLPTVREVPFPSPCGEAGHGRVGGLDLATRLKPIAALQRLY
jgi:hypothetical protein